MTSAAGCWSLPTSIRNHRPGPGARHGHDARRLYPDRGAACRQGRASGLKFFPASVLGAAGITAIRAVLPPDLMIAAVGGVSDTNFADYTGPAFLRSASAAASTSPA
jgi:hypothetical protein